MGEVYGHPYKLS